MEMKRFSWIAVLLALAIPAVFMSSCGKDDDDDEKEETFDDVKSVKISWSLEMDSAMYNLFNVEFTFNDAYGNARTVTADMDVSVFYTYSYADAPEKAVGAVVLKQREGVELGADSIYTGGGSLDFSVVGYNEDGSVNKYMNHSVKLQNSVRVSDSNYSKLCGEEGYSFVEARYPVK